jgi:hypothetical protein
MLDCPKPLAGNAFGLGMALVEPKGSLFIFKWLDGIVSVKPMTNGMGLGVVFQIL